MMFQLTDEHKKWFKIIGVSLVILGNAVLSFFGFVKSGGGSKLIDSQCEDWLLEHDEFTMPPKDCGEQIKYLKRRLNKEAEEHGF